jgi:hypothetical protein
MKYIFFSKTPFKFIKKTNEEQQDQWNRINQRCKGYVFPEKIIKWHARNHQIY